MYPIEASFFEAAHEGLPEQRAHHGAWQLVFRRSHGDGVAAHRVCRTMGA